MENEKKGIGAFGNPNVSEEALQAGREMTEEEKAEAVESAVEVETPVAEETEE